MNKKEYLNNHKSFTMEKLTRSFYVLLFSVMLLASCTKEDPAKRANAPLLVNFVNLTGSKIESARIDTTLIGTIGQGDQTGYIRLKSLSISGRTPAQPFTGVIDGRFIDSALKIWGCTTGSYDVSSGTYTFAIYKIHPRDEDVFDLSVWE